MSGKNLEILRMRSIERSFHNYQLKKSLISQINYEGLQLVFRQILLKGMDRFYYQATCNSVILPGGQ